LIILANFHTPYLLFYNIKKFIRYNLTVKLKGTSCLATSTQHVHCDVNFTKLVLETVGNSLPHSYLPTINWLLIALHYYGQSYRIHLIAFIKKTFTFFFFRYNHWAGVVSNTSILLCLLKTIVLVTSWYPLFFESILLTLLIANLRSHFAEFL